MRIEHIAVWTADIERLAAFYERYFEGRRNEKYISAHKEFQSYFLVFADGARLEIMTRPQVSTGAIDQETMGYTHIAFSVGSKEKVIELTDMITNDGYRLISLPRTTGDGYFESVVLDPDGNIVEITV
ncbi:MAG TPA: VOC family protein [Pseudobacteroides sp.]|uniref:VOC family protein n=1 Tax=Pseudobacteroides sp. TaxID=1968840 RepID=UPI002F95EDEF